MNKIAFISEHASPIASIGGVDQGGQNVYVKELAEGLSRKGFEVDIYTRRTMADQPAIVKLNDRVRVIHVKAGPDTHIPKEDLLPYMRAFQESMLLFIQEKELRYDLIHAHFFMSGLVAMHLSRMLDIPFVMSFHALGAIRKIYQAREDRFPPERVEIEKAIMQHATVIIASCPQDKADLIHFYGADHSKITILPCGYSPELFHPVPKSEARARVGWKEEEKIILHIGRLVPRKGVATIIDALPYLRKRYGSSVKLAIIGGEEPEIERLKNLARQSGMLEAILFLGSREQKVLKYYYSAADVFVTTPWYEPFCITIVEALACGTPTIGSRVGGVKHTIREGECGLLVEPNDHRGLAMKIQELLGNAARRAMFARNGIRRAKAHYTWPSIIGQMQGVYLEAAYNWTGEKEFNSLSS
ncbi:MAG TPA: glycosyltransferase [Flavihumibacter sp.]